MRTLLYILVVFFLFGCKNEPETSVIIGKVKSDSLIVADSIQEAKLKSKDSVALNEALISFDEINDSLIISKAFAKTMLYNKKLGWLLKPGIDGKDTLFANIEGKKYITEIDTIYLIIKNTTPIYDNCNYLVHTYSANLKFERSKWVLVESGEDTDVEKTTEETFVKGPYIIRRSEFAGSHCLGVYSSGVKYHVTYNGKKTESDFYYEIDSNNEGSDQRIADEDDPKSECQWYQSRGLGNIEYDKKRKALIFNSSKTIVQHFGHTCEDSTVTKAIKTEVIYKGHHGIVKEIDIIGGRKKILKET